MVESDSQRAKYLSPEEAVQYGLIDKVLYPEELRTQVRLEYPCVDIAYFTHMTCSL